MKLLSNGDFQCLVCPREKQITFKNGTVIKKHLKKTHSISNPFAKQKYRYHIKKLRLVLLLSILSSLLWLGWFFYAPAEFIQKFDPDEALFGSESTFHVDGLIFDKTMIFVVPKSRLRGKYWWSKPKQANTTWMSWMKFQFWSSGIDYEKQAAIAILLQWLSDFIFPIFQYAELPDGYQFSEVIDGVVKFTFPFSSDYCPCYQVVSIFGSLLYCNINTFVRVRSVSSFQSTKDFLNYIKNNG